MDHSTMERAMVKWMLGVLALATVLAGCGSSTAPSGRWSDPTKIDYYAGLHVNIARMTKTASGVFYWDSIHGSGTVPANPGDQLTVHYTLWLPDGTFVDNAGGQAFGPFTLSNTNVIQGWVDGLSGAVQGTTRQLVIPPALAYGSVGSGPIPPSTTLVFLVTVDHITPASSGDVVGAAPAGAVASIAAALVRSGAAARFR